VVADGSAAPLIELVVVLFASSVQGVAAAGRNRQLGTKASS